MSETQVREEPPRRLKRVDGLVALLFAIVCLLLAGRALVVDVCGLYHDDAVYVTTARSLVDGTGYRLISLPDAPNQTKYPILFPAILAFFTALAPAFPQNIVVFKAVTMLSGALAVACTFLFLVRFRYASRWVAGATCLLFATSPALAYYSTQILSEMPFALILVLVLWIFEAYQRGPERGRGAQVALGLTLVLPGLCRVLGSILVPVALLLLYRGGRRIRWVALGSSLLVVPWALWVLIGTASPATDPNLYYTDYLGWWLQQESGLGLHVVQRNARDVAACTVRQFMEGLSAWFEDLEQVRVVLFYGLSALGWGAILAAVRRGRVVPVYLAGYLLVIVLWPWPVTRFLVPIGGLVVATALSTFTTLVGRRYPRLWQRRLAVTLLLGLSLGNLWVCQRHAAETAEHGFPTDGNVDPVHWSDFEDLFTWIRAETPPDAVLASVIDSLLYLYTDRLGYRPFRNGARLHYGPKIKLGTSEQLAKKLARYPKTYLVLIGQVGFAENKPLFKLVQEIERTRPGMLVEVYRGSAQAFRVYRVERPGG